MNFLICNLLSNLVASDQINCGIKLSDTNKCLELVTDDYVETLAKFKYLMINNQELIGSEQELSDLLSEYEIVRMTNRTKYRILFGNINFADIKDSKEVSDLEMKMFNSLVKF